VIGFLVVRVRRALRAGDARGDVVERARTVALEMARLPALAEVLAGEVAVFYYAFAIRPRPHVPHGARAFSTHRETGVGAWFGCLAGISVVEAFVAHLVIASSSAVGAWIVTALSAYGTLWLVAVARSFALRPALVSDEALEIRSGLLASLRAPRSSIASVRPISAPDENDWQTMPFGAPNVRVTFTSPLEGRRLFGRARRVSQVALAVDDPSGFVEALTAHSTARCAPLDRSLRTPSVLS
jgi:hypothetical protein